MSFKRLVYLFFVSIFAAGCAANMSVNDKVIAVVGNKQITYGEFKREYAQNSLPTADTTDLVAKKEHFLNLLVNYDLKLLDARKENLRENPSINSEIKNYENQLAVGYILEHEITDPMVRKIYDRQKFEVRAEQVFVQIRPDSAYPAGDTLRAYDEAMGAIRSLKAGAPIDSLIHLYRGGDTYYITAGSFLQYAGGEQFEDLLYSLKPGEVGAYPIRTAFGYLVVKLTDKRPRYESIRASHILIRITGNSPADTLEAYQKAVAILDSARAGVDFAQLARDNSADTVSGKRGGDLGFFTRGMMVLPFEEAAFNIGKIGEVTGPVRTQFGYHIIKLTGVTPIPPYAEVKDQLRSKYLNAGYKLDLERFVGELKSKYGYHENEQVISMLCGKVDSAKSFAATDFDSLLTPFEMNEAMFTFDADSGTVDTVIGTAKSNEAFASLPITHANVEKVIDETSKDMVLSHYAMIKAPTYADFDSLIKKYEDGILIYQIEQNRVWSKVVTSDSVLKPYFESHADKYVWPKRVDLSRIEVGTAAIADSVHKQLQSGANFDTLASKYNTAKELKDKDGHWGLFADSSNTLATVAFRMKEGDFSQPVNYEGSYSIVRVNAFVPPQPKTFEEARGEVSSDYQEYESKRLQSEWIQSLRSEFGVKIDEKTFHELLAKE